MLISEVIERLKTNMAEYGDIPLVFYTVPQNENDKWNRWEFMVIDGPADDTLRILLDKY